MLRRLRNSESTPEIRAAAVQILKAHYSEPFGTEIPFSASNLSLVARLEQHYHPPGGVLRPWGPHKGVSVFVVVAPEIVSQVESTMNTTQRWLFARAMSQPYPTLTDTGGYWAMDGGKPVFFTSFAETQQKHDDQVRIVWTTIAAAAGIALLAALVEPHTRREATS